MVQTASPDIIAWQKDIELWAPSLKGTNTRSEGPPSRSNHHPEAPLPNTLAVGSGVQHRNFSPWQGLC